LLVIDFASIASIDTAPASRFAIAALIGLAVGLERESSGHASGPTARFAGIRTFLLLGMLGGGAGLMASQSQGFVAAVMLAGGMALSVAAYVMAVRRPGVDLDGTTEVAALVVLALGALAGSGWLTLAAGAGAIAVLALSEKTRLHTMVQRVDGVELRAGLQFAVLALVVLPLLPEGPIGGWLAIHPRTLWVIVLLFSGLNFLGYLARRFAGPDRGYGITGLLGGVISSTAVTVDFSRRSRLEPDMGAALARGVIGACIVLIPRVLTVSALMDRDVALALIPLLLPAAILGVGVLAFMWRRQAHDGTPAASVTKNPLQLWTAIRMAIAFQVAISLIAFVRRGAGTTGVYASGALLGLTDVDALTVSMSRAGVDLTARVAAHAIAIGILANTLLKLGVSLALGTTQFRRVAAIGLVGLAVGSGIGLVMG
jgi:uncharacterized membrane protein (DUF4010 family)